MTDRNVVRKIPLLAKSDAKQLMAATLLRLVGAHGKGSLSDAAGVHQRTIEGALAMTSLPELDTALNLLRCDLSAFDELLAHYRLRVVPIEAADDGEAELLAAELALAAEHAKALADKRSPGRVDNIELGRLIKLARPVARIWAGRVAAADRKRA